MVLSNEFYYERVQLDTINERFNKVPTAKEGDANGRGMIVVLTENGLVKNTTGVSLLFKWEHTRISGAQGLENFEALDLTKGEYKVAYPTEMNHEGYVKAEIRIIDNGKYAGSRNMKIQVEPSVGDDTAMESSNEFAALVTALVKTNHMENLLNETIANVTVDSEVITARNSTAKQKTFTVLDERMEDLEKDVYYPANNELTQADFAATTGWSVYRGTLAVANNVASVTGTSGLYPNVYQDINCEVGDKLYYAAQARVTTAGATAIALRSEGVEITTDNARVLAPLANQWYQLDCIKTAFETTPSFAVSQRYALAADATGKVLQVKKPIALNLTKIFGANAIPTIEQIRAILSRFTDSHFVGNEGLSQPALLMGKALSLEAQFNAAVAGLTVDGETINARVGKDNTTHATLKARLDSEKSTTDQSLVSLGQQLEQKADIADLPSSAYTFKGSTTFAALPTTGNTLGDVRYTTDNLVNYAWTGTAWTPIGNGAFGDGSVVTKKIADKAVTRAKTDFVAYSPNDFDKTKATAGRFIDGSTGGTLGNASFSYSDYIPIVPGKVYKTNGTIGGGSYGSAVYDANKTFIRGNVFTANIVAPVSGEELIRFTIPNAEIDTAMFALQSDFPLSYVPFTIPTLDNGIKVDANSLTNLSAIKRGALSRFYGKKISVLSDSISNPANAYATKNWNEILVENLAATADFKANDGSTISVGTNGSTPMCLRYTELANDADLVIVFGGTNDWGFAGCTKGTMLEVDGLTPTKDTSTFYGSVNTLLEGLLNKYGSRNTTIMLMTPIPRSTPPDKDFPDGGRTSGMKLWEVADVMIECANYYSVPVLDTNRKSRMPIFIGGTLRTQYSVDGLHPNNAGHLILADVVAGFLNSI